MINAIGCIELNSIARGYLVADTMLKTATVEILFNRTICPGKFMVLIAGDIASVNTAIESGKIAGSHDVVDDLIISNIHPDIFKAISGNRVIEKTDALGVVETFSIASIIEAADAAVKAASVDIIEIHLAMAIGGKGFFTLTGDVASVEAAVKAAVEKVKAKGLLVGTTIIPQPSKEILAGKV